MNEQVLQCVYAAIDESNEDRVDLPPLEKSPSTVLHGTKTALDSLGLINFLVAVEEGVGHELGAPIALSDDRSLSREPSPFGSVRALVEYIEELLYEQR